MPAAFMVSLVPGFDLRNGCTFSMPGVSIGALVKLFLFAACS